MPPSHSPCGEPVPYNLGTAPTAKAIAVHEIYQQVWSALAASTDRGEVFREDGVLISSAGGKWPVMNTVFLSTSVATEADLQQRISLAKRYFGQKKRSWLFIVFNEWLHSSIQAEQVFSSSGLSHMQTCVGMQATNFTNSPSLGPELAYRLVENDGERLEFSEINADSYGFSSEWSRDIAIWASQWSTGNVRAYIAYCGSEGVSTALVYLMKHTAYLGFVGTRRAHQRKGYAEAIARYALATTNEHWHFNESMLHSTPAALSLYRSMGYSEVTGFGIYLGICE